MMEDRLPLPLTETPENACTNLDDLIKPFDDLSLESEDDSDEIQDIFEEFHRESFLRPYAVPYKKYLTLPEANRLTVEKFTDEFKKSMSEVREEISLRYLLFDEESAIEKLLERQQKTCVVNPDFAKNRGTPIEIEKQVDEESTSSSAVQSNFWRMLATNSTSKFQVSPPVFDAFRQEEKHWLERPPIVWETVEASRTKCKQWLEGTP